MQCKWRKGHEGDEINAVQMEERAEQTGRWMRDKVKKKANKESSGQTKVIVVET